MGLPVDGKDSAITLWPEDVLVPTVQSADARVSAVLLHNPLHRHQRSVLTV